MVPRTPPGGITLTYPDGSEVGITARQVGTVIRRGTTTRSTPEYVMFTMRCPSCGQDARWMAEREDDRSRLNAPDCCGAAA